MERNFKVYWERLCRANPKLSESTALTITPKALQDLLEKAYRQGDEDRADLQKSLQKFNEGGDGLFGLGSMFKR